MTATPSNPAMQAMLCFNVYATNLAFARFYRPFLGPLGLTYPQYLVMLSLHGTAGKAGGGKTLRDLTAELGLESNTLSPLLQRMAKAGQITRTRGTADERTVLVQLTPAGAHLAAKAALVPDCVRSCIALPAADMVQTTAALARLRVLLEAAPEKNGDPGEI